MLSAALSAATGATAAAVVVVEQARESVSAAFGHPKEYAPLRLARDLDVVVPVGCKAGDLLHVNIGCGLWVPILVPDGVGAGILIRVRLLRADEVRAAMAAASAVSARAGSGVGSGCSDGGGVHGRAARDVFGGETGGGRVGGGLRGHGGGGGDGNGGGCAVGG